MHPGLFTCPIISRFPVPFPSIVYTQTHMSETIILKLGGSVITEKDRTDYNIREELLHEVFAQMKKYLDDHPDKQLILVHGAGGHVHMLAAKYGLKTGAGDDPDKQRGALLTREAAGRLNTDVVALGTAAGLLLVSVPTHTVVESVDARIEKVDIDTINHEITAGRIPVLYGDMVPDTTLTYSICSGDAVVAYLAAAYGASRILFASDIDGVFTADPHIDPDTTLIESVSLSNLDASIAHITESHNIDTTGGLRGKLDACENLFEHASDLKSIEIFNGLVPENYEKALNGTPFLHTQVTQ